MQASRWKKILVYLSLSLLGNLAFAVHADAYEEDQQDLEEISAGGGEVSHLLQLAGQDDLLAMATQEE
jgi:hypothetical protein